MLLAGLIIGIGAAALFVSSLVQVHNPALPLLEAAANFYESVLKFMLNDFILINFKSGTLAQIWNSLAVLQPFFLAIGGALVFDFLVLQYFSEIQDLHRDFNPRTLFKLLISIAVTNYFVLNSYRIITLISDVMVSCANYIDKTLRAEFLTQGLQMGTLSEETLHFLNKKGSALEMGFLAIITIIISAIILFSTINVLRYFIERGIHLLILSIFAPVFFGLMVNKDTRSMTINYLKEFIFKYIDGLVIVIIMIIAGTIIRLVGNQLFDFSNQYFVLFSVMYTVTITSVIIQHAHRIFDRIR